MCLLFDSVVKSVFYVNTSVLDISVASEIGTFSHFLQVDVLDNTVEPYVCYASFRVVVYQFFSGFLDRRPN